MLNYIVHLIFGNYENASNLLFLFIFFIPILSIMIFAFLVWQDTEIPEIHKKRGK